MANNSQKSSHNLKLYLIVFVHFYALSLLFQLSGGVVTNIFVGEFDLASIFGNFGQYILNSLFFAGLLIGLWFVSVKLISILKYGFNLAVSAFICASLVPVLLVFGFASRESSIPITASFRGCYVKIDGIITDCGWASLYSDLFAQLLSIVAVSLTLFINLGKSNGRLDN